MKFTILEEESGAHLVPGGFSQGMLEHKKIIGDTVKNALFYRKGDHFKWCYKMQEFGHVGSRACQKIVKSKKFTDKLSKNIRKESQKLFNFAQKIIHQDLSQKSNQELAKIYLRLIEIFKNLYALGLVIETAEVYNSFFSKLVHQQLERHIVRKKLKENASVLLSVLTAPTEQSMTRAQEKSFLELLKKIKENRRTREMFDKTTLNQTTKLLSGLSINKAIDQHLDKYRCVNYNYEGPALDKKTLIKDLKKALEKTNPQEELKNINKTALDIKKQQKNILDRLSPDKSLKGLLSLAKEFTTLKFIRKESIAYGNYAKDLINLQACRRFKITLNQARCMKTEELVVMLKRGTVDRPELSSREKELACLQKNGKEYVFSDQKARQLSRLIAKPKIEKIDKIQGTVASPGQAKGRVKIINQPKDMSKMNQGDILVASATNPAFLPAMKKAAAIVTDMGGLTCHAAIVSRELGIPCVVGTKVATMVLKDGILVEVDATHGKVTIIKKVR